MNKRIKIFLTSLTLILSMVVMVFGVLASSNYDIGVKNHIIFDIEDNIACDIDAVSAIGTSPNVVFNGTHANAKTLSLTTDMDNDSGTFIYKGGNTSLSANGTWSPWTENDPASIDYRTDTIYWIYKITNKSENVIQVRITDTSDKTLFTMNKNMQLIKKFGTSANTTPDQTDSGEIEKDQSVYVLIALEAKDKSANLSSQWNYKIHIEKANASYLMTSWKDQFDEDTRDEITTINFVGGDGEEYSEEEPDYYFGATNKTGEAELDGNENNYPNVNQITGYLNGTTLTVHSKGPIYAPVDSSFLFAPENEDEDFFGFEYLESITFDNFNTSNVKNMSRFFNNWDGCFEPNITSLDLSNFDTSNVVDMSGMLSWMSSLTNLDLSNFDTSSCTDMSCMFSNCYNLENLNISSFNTSKVTNMSLMFYHCSKLTKLDVSNFDTSNAEDMSSMFSDCSLLKELDLSNFDTSSVTIMSSMFSWCSSTTTLDLSNFDTSSVTSMNQMFSDCRSLTELDVSNFDTSSVTDMGSMFYNCSKLTKLDLSNFDTSSVTDMSEMFEACTELKELDVSNFDTSSVTNMRYMFFNCCKLKELDVSNFDTSSVTDMSYMFRDCSSLTELDLSNFDTSSVTNMSSMFSGCSSLTELDLSNFYIKDNCRVTDMLKLQGTGSTTEITKLVTPKYVGTSISLSGLGFTQTTIAKGSSSTTLTK